MSYTSKWSTKCQHFLMHMQIICKATRYVVYACSYMHIQELNFACKNQICKHTAYVIQVTWYLHNVNMSNRSKDHTEEAVNCSYWYRCQCCLKCNSFNTLFYRKENGCKLTYTVHAQSVDLTSWTISEHIPDMSSYMFNALHHWICNSI